MPAEARGPAPEIEDAPVGEGTGELPQEGLLQRVVGAVGPGPQRQVGGKDGGIVVELRPLHGHRHPLHVS
jgi:hypothetical protein